MFGKLFNAHTLRILDGLEGGNMFLCFMAIEREGKVRHELCLVPDKPDPLSLPVRIEDLEPTDSAVFRIGESEAVVVSIETDGSTLLAPCDPALIYLTPNLVQYPGMRAKYAKVQKIGERRYRTFFSKDKAKWEEWVPTRPRA